MKEKEEKETTRIKIYY